MAGIYIHIPFCKQTCHYCNFHFSTSIALKNGFLDALLKEISLQKEFLKGEIVETVYLGGGTPSLLSEAEIERILNGIDQNFSLHPKVEITLEANPDDIGPDKLFAWKQQGINRLSIGVQSFHDEDLRWMNRAHNASQADRSIKQAQDSGFSNITIDLIFGTPTLPDSKLRENIDRAILLNIPHLSCYSLTVEPKTALYQKIRKKLIAPIDTEQQARQFLLTMGSLQTAGYEQYEISNYALNGMYSRHNSAYWQGKSYLGLGPSAHSFNGNIRQWNISNNALYIQSLQNGTIPFELEQLTPIQKLNEWIMTSLRLSKGLPLSHKEGLTPLIVDKIKTVSRKFIERKLLVEKADSLILTTEGKLFADGIAAELFFEEDEIRESAFAAGF